MPRLSAPLRGAIVAFAAWLILVFISQLIRGGSIVPPSMSALSFWGLMSFIAVLMALVAYVLTALVQLLAGVKK